jgi:hypothetical protein
MAEMTVSIDPFTVCTMTGRAMLALRSRSMTAKPSRSGITRSSTSTSTPPRSGRLRSSTASTPPSMTIG